MPINVVCPGCEQQYNVPDDKAGRKFRCKQCQEIVSIPDAGSSSSGYADPAPSPSRRSRSDRAQEDDFGDDYPPPRSRRSSRGRSNDYDDDYDDDDDGYSSSRSRRSSRGGRRGSRSRGRQRSGGSGQTAGLGKRFLGALIDGFFGGLVIVPGYVMMIAGAEGDSPELAITGLIVLGGGGLTVLAVQIFLLATRSQSLGKYLVGTRIHDYESGEPASAVQTILLRLFVNQLIASICGIYGLIDVLFIFGDEHRCLHDQIASTYVEDIS
ncbi:MAG: RDD family protein [Planctomycetaceae bacterium]|nr:RDD family protein [Planctomycetaceae bacterium]MCA9042905.1 RDD family protein [Planctomycetaceae bacterium]MCB9953788.1 RDD family protein [Planctomycetaceae bacterium]